MRVKGAREYDPNYHPKRLLELMEQGKLNIHIIASFKITEKTFYQWLKEHPEFKEAYDIGLPMVHSAWLQKGEEYMESDRDKPFRYWCKVMDVKFNYAKEAGTAGGTTNKTTNVYIDNMNVLQSKNKDELLELITKKLSHNDSIPAEYRLLEQDNQENNQDIIQESIDESGQSEQSKEQPLE